MDRGNGLEVIGWAEFVAGQVVWSVHRIAQPWADVALIALRFTHSAHLGNVLRASPTYSRPSLVGRHIGTTYVT